jgi:ribosome biogenesis GTPase
MQGLVTSGSKNIFIVRDTTSGEEFKCRIKGKVLDTGIHYYNPIACGDIVECVLESSGDYAITDIAPRKNMFTRFNTKGSLPQILAANVDNIVVITSAASPPYRPNFIDRVLLQASLSNINAIIVCNKIDIARSSPKNLLSMYSGAGYTVVYTSMRTGVGIRTLHTLLHNTRSVFIGQSGVGKSSIINELIPDAMQRTGEINKKWNRGNHTTVMNALFFSSNYQIIDTPGVRLFLNHDIAAGDVSMYMREFKDAALSCAYGLSCTHTNEDGCKILEAVLSGKIHKERYENYLKIVGELKEREKRRQ